MIIFGSSVRKSVPLMREALVGERDASLYNTTEAIIKPEHSGVAFILSKTYRRGMSLKKLLEVTMYSSP